MGSGQLEMETCVRSDVIQVYYKINTRYVLMGQEVGGVLQPLLLDMMSKNKIIRVCRYIVVDQLLGTVCRLPGVKHIRRTKEVSIE